MLGIVVCELRQVQQCIQRRVATAGDEHAPAHVSAALSAQDIGNAIAHERRGRAFPHRRQSRRAQRAGLLDGSRSVDDGARQDLFFAVDGLEANDVGRILPAGVFHPIVAVTRHRDDSRVEADTGRELRRCRERLEILLHEVGARWVLLIRRRCPALPLEQSTGGRVDVELPRREHADMAPTANPIADARARLDDERGHAAGDGVRCGSQTDRPGTDDDDRKRGPLTHSPSFSDPRFSGISRSTITTSSH